MPENNTLFLVDGSSLAFRSYFALITTRMANAEGTPTAAVYGFFASLFDLIEKHSPHSMAICFDLAEPTFRHEQFEDYKAHRDEMPDDLVVQWPLIKEAVEALAIPLYELAGWEADDVIGTVAKSARQRNLRTVILTGDQDAFQLLDDHIEVLMPTKEGLKTYGRNEVFEKLGVWPEQIIDYKGLCGDTSDNIPGVKGIGPKTAVALLSQYKNIEGIYEHVEEVKSASQKSKLIDGKTSAFQSRELATIRLDVPLDFDFDHCQMSCPEPNKICEIFRKLELRNLLRRMPKVLSHFNNGVEPKIDSELLQVPTRARMKSGMGAGGDRDKQLAAAKSGSSSSSSSSSSSRTGAGSTHYPAAPTGGGRQLSLLDAFGDTAASGVAASATAVLKQEEFKVEILKNRADIMVLIEELKAAGHFAMALRASHSHALSSHLHGLSFCYSGTLVLDDLQRLSYKEQKPPTRIVYVPLEAAGEAPLSREEVVEAFKPLFEDAQIGKEIYDAKYAANVLSIYGVQLNGVVFDPMLYSYILNPDENHSLSQIIPAFLDGRRLPELPSPGGRRTVELDILPIRQLAELTAEEARGVEDLSAKFVHAMDEDQKELLYSMDLPVSRVLAHMEQNGVRLDLPYFKELGKEMKNEIARLEKEVYELASHPFNIGSPIQLQKVLFEELKLPAKVKTKTGYSTDHSVLEGLLDSHPIIGKILEYRHLTKLSSTYVESLPKQISPVDGRLHGEFNQAATSTGRLSSTNPNLQNIPIRTEWGRRIRRGFIGADANAIVVSADYSQIELRLLAHMSGDEKLIEAFQNDEDIHSKTASLIFDLPIDQLDSEKRGVGKTLNFALIYQQGAFATGQSLGISTKEAQQFIDKYFESFPKVRSFMLRVIEDARKSGFVQTLWGRKRHFSHLNDRNEGIRKADERAAFNAPLQGSAADLMKLAMINLDNELEKRGMKTKLVLQVHDELVLDVPPEELDEAKEVLHTAMSMGNPLKVPLKVDVASGKNWMDAK